MPLWFHPPPIAVDLGAPVHPAPLLYHPQPYLVDPRPYHPYDTVYCACQFSFTPERTTPWIGSRPLARANNYTIRSSAARLRKVKEVEWDCEKPPPEAKTVTNVIIERTGFPRTTTVNIKVERGAPCQCHHPISMSNTKETNMVVNPTVRPGALPRTPRAISNPELSKRAGMVNPQPAEALRAEIAAEITAQQSYEKAREEQIRAEVRAEIRAELEAENLERIRKLAEQEIDIERRLAGIKEKEDLWIRSYGDGIVKGDGTKTARNPRISTPADKILTELNPPAEPSTIPEAHHMVPIINHPKNLLSTNIHSHIPPPTDLQPVYLYPIDIPEVQDNHSTTSPFGEEMHPASARQVEIPSPAFLPIGSYMVDESLGTPSYQHLIFQRPPPPTVYTLSTTSGSECSITWAPGGSSWEEESRVTPSGDRIIEEPEVRDPNTQEVNMMSNVDTQPIYQDFDKPSAAEEHYMPGIYHPTPLRHPQMMQINPYTATTSARETILQEIKQPAGRDIIITISRSDTGTSTTGTDTNTIGSEHASIISELREGLHKVAAEYQPPGKRVHWGGISGSGASARGSRDAKEGSMPRSSKRAGRRQGEEREMGIVEPPLRRRC